LERKIIETDIVLEGYGQFNPSIIHRRTAFMTGALFDRWSDEVSFPWVEKRRSQFPYTGKVILLMDGLGANHTDAFLHKCAEKNMEVIFFVAYSSDQCQSLDLLPITLLKSYFSA
jgi:hypothetical protein